MKRFDGYMNGVNIGGWVSQCRHTIEHYDNFFKKEDVMKIKSWGLDHIRVPVDYELVEDKDGNYIEENFKYIDNVILWCKEAGLHMVLDLHRTFGYSFYEGDNENGFFENEDLQERFYRLWENFAQRYGKYEDMLCFELLNEVTDKSYCDPWNRISTECIKRIRKIAPTVKILVGGYWNNSVEAVLDLLEPYDENIVYNFHCYEPLIFTHQKAMWIQGMKEDFSLSFDKTYKEMDEANNSLLPYLDSKMLSYCDDENEKFGEKFFDKFFKAAVELADKRGVILYCGEYGVIDQADPEDTLKWFVEIHKVFEKYGIGRSVWSYKSMNFGLSDAHYDSIRDRLIKYL